VSALGQGADTGVGRGGAEPYNEDEGVADHSRAGEEELGHAAGRASRVNMTEVSFVGVHGN